MKQQAIQNSFSMLHKLENIEKDLGDLKLSILKKLAPSGKKEISFRSILKGIDVSDEDIAMAQKSLYSKIRV